MSRKILFIDTQAFQTDAWDRGMGKYSLSLIKGLFDSPNYSYEKTYLIFTNSRPVSKEATKKIKEIAPRAKRLYLDLKLPTSLWDSDTLKQEAYNKKILDETVAMLTGKGEDADFLMLALFTYYACPVFPSRTFNTVIGYDIIPLLYSNRYQVHPVFEPYLTLYRVLFEADRILTISQTVSDDFSLYLGIGRDKLCNIGGAAVDRKHEIARRPRNLQSPKFVLMPSGDDLRKNNLRAVQGFEKYCQSSRDDDVRLVITSHFTEVTKSELLAECSRITFVGNVTEGELSWLYKHAECVLFASEYEGLGLPILEALEANRPVVCSSIGAFQELSAEAFYFVDQFDTANICWGLRQAIGLHEWSDKQSSYASILKQFSWGNTAERALAALSNQSKSHLSFKKKQKVAIFCPNPEGYSAIGKVVLQQHPSLAERFDVDYYIEDATSVYAGQLKRPSYLNRVANVFKASEFNARTYKKYAAIYYHIGNSEYHLETIKSALYMPGIAIIHDTNLRGVFEGPLLERRYVDGDRVHSERLLDKMSKDSRTSFLTSLVNAQRAIIVHSEYARSAIQALTENVPVIKAELPAATPQLLSIDINKQVHIGVAGILHQVKGVAVLEEAAKLKEFSNCTFYMFGLSMLSEDDLFRLKSYPNINLATDVTDFEFQTTLSKLDILINYRASYMGETSLTVIEAMRYGVTPVVRDIGWYSELSEDCVIKIRQEDQLLPALKQAVSNLNNTKSKGIRGHQYIEQYHTFEAYAEVMNQALYGVTSRADKTNQNELIARAFKKGASKQSILKLIGYKAE